jgi:hypothetical protein
MNDYSGTCVDLEVARYGLRTFKPMLDAMDWDILMACLNTPWDMTAFTEPAVDQDTVLGSVYVTGQHWLEGTCSAECIATHPTTAILNLLRPPEQREHEAPHVTCHCGIYATHSLEHLAHQYPYYTKNLVAVIAAEGQTIMGDKGFRTQHARVVAYWCSPEYFQPCIRQFKGAEFYSDRDKMLKDFKLS